MTSRVELFERSLTEAAPAFAREFARTRQAYPDLYPALGEDLLLWAEAALGPAWPEQLVDGYCEFVVDVNRSQLKYEKTGRYENSSFDDVFKHAYSSPDFMQLYHWGVYATTFVWKHHLRLFEFFEREFLPLLAGHTGAGTLLDLGCGSGVWHLLAMKRLPGWKAIAVDISAPTLERSRKMAAVTAYGGAINHILADALSYAPPSPAEAGISCFLLEHLEKPHRLLEGLAESLKPGAFAFVTSALTAAEVDHIFEFRRESELLSACESAGFRTRAMLSSEPEATPADRYFLPRSIALVLQKRRNAIW